MIPLKTPVMHLAFETHFLRAFFQSLVFLAAQESSNVSSSRPPARICHSHILHVCSVPPRKTCLLDLDSLFQLAGVCVYVWERAGGILL